MLDAGSLVNLWPRRGFGLACIERGRVLREDELGLVLDYTYDNRRQVGAFPWSSVGRVELLEEPAAA